MKRIAVEWKQGRPQGRVEVQHGRVTGLTIARGRGKTKADTFEFRDPAGRLEIILEANGLQPTGTATIVTIRAAEPFSFFLRDVNADTPILLPALGVAVTTADDTRSYAAIEVAISARGLQTDLQRIATTPEASYADAAAHTRSISDLTWLGVGRDLRIFTCGFHDFGRACDVIMPRFCDHIVKTPESGEQTLWYGYSLGRGIGCTQPVTRRLEDGALPILRATRTDDEVEYHAILFATVESGSLKNLRGTDYLVADGHGTGHMFTPEQQAEYDRRVSTELEQDETILCVQATAVNTAAVPRYTFVQAPGPGWQSAVKMTVDAQGLATFESGRVGCVYRLNGAPLAQREVAILLQPGASAIFEFYVPHRPIPRQRALALTKFDFATKHVECRQYWQAKLAQAGQMQLPESRINEMVRAGILHLDLIAYGREPRGTLCPAIGVYTAIGSESAPIIQFYDSLGWHDEAARSLQFFLDKQRPDGFIQNFGGYMLETGPFLWSMGEHWRYTRDTTWLKKVAPQVLKSCEFIRQWRARNQREELRGRGYGLMEGKVGDPEDHFRQFMLNGYAYLGLKRAAEMLAKLLPQETRRLAKEAAALRADILTAFRDRLAASPVVPLGDGTWCPTCPPWAEEAAPLLLYAKPGSVFTHGAVTCRDSLVGPLYLVFSEVLDPHERAADWLLDSHTELMTTRNVAFTQPFYSRHDWVHLQRGEVKAFLQTYYNGFAALADRETYTFWEHLFGGGPHKTHEEAWFLMQTRWMLWLEAGNTLRLLPGIPRAWLESGKSIALANVASYFGPVTLHVESQLDHGVIEATIECRSTRQPATIELRIPHPRALKARQVRGGKYDAARETVRITKFKNSAKVTLTF